MSVARGGQCSVPNSNGQLHATSECIAIHLFPPQPRLPDRFFTATHGYDWPQIIPAISATKNAPEKNRFRQMAAQHGYEVEWLPEKLYFRAERRRAFWRDAAFCGYNFAPIPSIVPGRQLLSSHLENS